MKTIHLVWRDDRPASWCDDLRADLTEWARTQPLSRLQVNLADAAVSTAMLRLTTFEQPVAAVVSVWAPDPLDIAPLASLADHTAGYEVSETVRLEPPTAAVGERSAGLANIALLRRPPDLDHAEWLRRWHIEHTAVAIETQATFGYVQNVVVRRLDESAPPIDGIVEEQFPIEALTDPHAFYGSGGDAEELMARVQRMAGSVARFGADRNVDVVPTSRFVLK